MDPDSFFIIILYLVLLVVTVVNLAGLSKKIWASAIPKVLKIVSIGILFFLLVIGLLTIDTVYSGQALFSPVQIVILLATIVIAGNWSINISLKLSTRKGIKSSYLVITLMTIGFCLLILFSLYWFVTVIDKLNLLGSGGG